MSRETDVGPGLRADPDVVLGYLPSRPVDRRLVLGRDAYLRSGTILYLGLFIMLRMVLKRQSQGVSITDILLIVLIADASQNGMADEYRSVSEGLVLVATLVFWNYTLDWLAFRFPWFEKLILPQPLVLVQDGKILRRNMRQELITVEELMTSLRHQGIEKVHDVERAFMEPDGTISVIKRNG